MRGAHALVAHGAADASETLGGLLLSWERLPSALTLAALLTSGFVVVLGRSSAEGPVRRRALIAWGGAMLALVLAIGSPIDALGAHLASGHMLQHMLLGDVLPALVMVALIGGAGSVLAALVARTPLRWPLRVMRAAPAWIIVLAWALVWGYWHTAAAYDAALTSPVVHVLEHASLVLVGGWLWWTLVDPVRQHPGGDVRRIGVAVGVLFFGAVLTNWLTFVTEPRWTAYIGYAERLVGWSTVDDQQLSGLIMLTGQGITIGIALWVIVRRHLRMDRAHAAGHAHDAHDAHDTHELTPADAAPAPRASHPLAQ